jgi:hypothetical protein
MIDEFKNFGKKIGLPAGPSLFIKLTHNNNRKKKKECTAQCAIAQNILNSPLFCIHFLHFPIPIILPLPFLKVLRQRQFPFTKREGTIFELFFRRFHFVVALWLHLNVEVEVSLCYSPLQSPLILLAQLSPKYRC